MTLLPPDQPPDPVAGQPGHFAWARWIKSAIIALDQGVLPLSGGTMTGRATLSADPTAALHATTKQYADGKVAKTGGTMTGDLTIDKASGTTELIVDAKGSNAGGVRMRRNGVSYWRAALASAGEYVISRYNTTTGAIIESSLKISSGGYVSVARDPASALGVATKQYVDKQYIQSGTVSLSGDPEDTRIENVVFPIPYTSTPNVWLQTLTGTVNSGNISQMIWPDNASATDVDVKVNRSNATTVVVRWFAMGPI